jgi:drug/metabolite transporter (DMT)-like permease
VTVLVQATAVLTALVGVLVLPGSPHAGALGWGALAGIGSAVGTAALYRGFAAGAMSPVATSSAVLAAVIPAVVGVATGDRPSLLVTVGIVLAVPAIAMVSWQGSGTGGPALGTGLLYGAVAGIGFGWLFVAFDQAGTGSGSWPVVPSTTTALLLVLPFGRGGGRPNASWRTPAALAASAGLLGVTSNVLFLHAAGNGQLAVVAVLSSLYPAGTVLLARFLLHEGWTRLQAAGLVTAAGAVVLVGLG